MSGTEIEAANGQEQRDEAIAEALTAGRSLRAVRKEFGLSAAELDGALERVFPIDIAARLRMIKTDLGKLDRLTQVFYEKALAGCIQSGLLTVRIWERKHELLGMNSAAKIEIVQAPLEEPTSYERIKAAIMSLKYDGNGDGALPPDGNGSGEPAASDTGETS
jgi:hypothetical protein